MLVTDQMQSEFRLCGCPGESEARVWQEAIRNEEDSQKRKDFRAPLGRILWALKVHGDKCRAYGKARLTNARTELVNAKIRRYVRQGHRYSPETLVTLINRDVEQSRSRRAVGLPPAENQESVDAQAEPPEPSSHLQPPRDQPVPERQGIRTAEPPPGPKSRHRLVPDYSISLPEHIWKWLHAKTEPERRQRERWYHIVLASAPPADSWAWKLLCRGKRRERKGDMSLGIAPRVVTSIQLTHWRLSVLHIFFEMQAEQRLAQKRRQEALLKAEHSETLSPAGYEPLAQLQGLNIDRLMAEDPALASQLDRVWRQLVATSYESLIKPDHLVILGVQRWHRKHKKPVAPAAAEKQARP